MTNSFESNSIPIYIKDCYCNIHKKFFQSYLKYSKRGLCSDCSKQNNFIIENFVKDDILNLIKKKKT